MYTYIYIYIVHIYIYIHIYIYMFTCLRDAVSRNGSLVVLCEALPERGRAALRGLPAAAGGAGLGARTHRTARATDSTHSKFAEVHQATLSEFGAARAHSGKTPSPATTLCESAVEMHMNILQANQCCSLQAP